MGMINYKFFTNTSPQGCSATILFMLLILYAFTFIKYATLITRHRGLTDQNCLSYLLVFQDTLLHLRPN